MSISLRISWSDEKEKKDVDKIVNAVKKTLEKRKYTVSVSRPYANRDNSGGRIYVNLSR